jgi:hypothetical protein
MTDGCGVMYDVYGNIEVLKTGHRTRLYKVLRKLRGAKALAHGRVLVSFSYSRVMQSI